MYGMFYYYGRKKRIAGSYPGSLRDTIVEPFAGSAAYSLHGQNWRKRVILVEKNPEIVALWRWFIQEATPEDIRALPDPVLGQKTTSRLHILHAASNSSLVVKSHQATPHMMSGWVPSKRYMAATVLKVKHWEIIEGDYSAAPDIEATWFVDPPYQGEPGKGYKHSSALIDYDQLGAWVKARKGEVIACDQTTATWLPFAPLVRQRPTSGDRTSTEGYYYRSPYRAPTLLEMFD